MPPLPCTTSMSATNLRLVHGQKEREKTRRTCCSQSSSYADRVKQLGEEQEEEMSSDCSSGCQSGWTMYFEQSSFEFSNTLANEKGVPSQHEDEEEELEEEDLSMVSDASSGPPQLRQEDEKHCCCYRKSNIGFGDIGCLCSGLTPPAAVAKDGFKRRRVGGVQQKEPSSVLVDTATSPLYSHPQTSFNNNNNSFVKPFVEGVRDFYYGFSYAHLEEKHALQKQMDYLQSFTDPFKPNPATPMSRDGGNKIW